jgi:DNA-binding transcriptional LysR family regulator
MQQKLQRGAAPVQHAEKELIASNWDDLRLFLACADAGSFRKVAESLDLTSTTVMRRIDRLEEQFGFALFVRHQVGLKLTDEGRTLIEDVRQMERLSFNVLRRAAHAGANPVGTARVAVTEGVGTYWVMPKLIEFQRTYRLLTVDLRCAMEVADIARLEADMAIQFGPPENPDLIVTKLGRLHVYPFASEEYAREHGVPTALAEMREHRFVHQVAPQVDESRYARIWGLESLEGTVGIRTNSSTAMFYAIERGAGVGILPTATLALGAPFVACDVGVKDYYDLWLAYHPDLKRSEKHMVVVDWLRRIFDPATYPCFRDEFIHPNDLVPMMADTAQSMSLRGYASTMGSRKGR